MKVLGNLSVWGHEAGFKCLDEKKIPTGLVEIVIFSQIYEERYWSVSF